jgi:hypothetical protein
MRTSWGPEDGSEQEDGSGREDMTGCSSMNATRGRCPKNARSTEIRRSI